MKLWKGIVEVTGISRYNCTVMAKNAEDARQKLESDSPEIKTTYPCTCGCNRDHNRQVRKAHSIQVVC